MSTGGAAFAYRYLASGAIENDHFVALARAHQVLAGAWPVRDFVDPGQPLAYLASAAAAAVFGPTLLVDVLLAVIIHTVSTVLTFFLARRATGSTTAALVAAAAGIVVYPRLYNATKVMVPVVAIWLAWRYADIPRTKNLFWLALWTAVAFLLRHDYIVYVALSYAVLLALVHRGVTRDAMRTLLVYAAFTLLFIAPWLIYVQVYQGVPQYYASALRFVAAEGRRTLFRPGLAVWLLAAIPAAALLISLRPGLRLTTAQLASASVLVLSMDVVFLRDVLVTRLPDVVAPTAIVAAGVAGHVWPPRRITAVALGALAVLLLLSLRFVPRATVPGPATVAEQAVRVTTRLEYADREIQPEPALAPLVEYLSHCTPSTGRVLVSGFGPEIPVLARRPFAGGLPTWIPGYYQDPDDERRALVQLEGEPVAAAVMLDGSMVFLNSWPSLGRWLVEHFEEHPVPSINSRLRVWLPRRDAVARPDPATGLPCRLQ